MIFLSRQSWCVIGSGPSHSSGTGSGQVPSGSAHRLYSGVPRTRRQRVSRRPRCRLTVWWKPRSQPPSACSTAKVSTPASCSCGWPASWSRRVCAMGTRPPSGARVSNRCGIAVGEGTRVARQAPRFGVQQAPSVVQGDVVRPSREGLPPGLLPMAEELALGPAVGAADDSPHRPHQDVGQVVPFGPVDPRVLQGPTRDEGIRLAMRGLRRLNPELPIVATRQPAPSAHRIWMRSPCTAGGKPAAGRQIQ